MNHCQSFLNVLHLGEPQPDFVWLRSDGELLSIGGDLIKNKLSDNLKIHADGRSLIIVNFSSALNGVYTCFSRAGQSYAYDVSRDGKISVISVPIT